MRVMTMGDMALSAAFGLLMLMGLGAAIGTIAYITARYPGALPIWPALGMGLAVGAMDRTTGDVRRAWAWVACAMGVLAVLGILLT